MARLEPVQAKACFLGLERDEVELVLPPLVGIARIKFVGTGNRVDPNGSKGWVAAL